MNICMVGAGYVGLVSSACFAEFGWTIECVDQDADRVAALRRGEVPIYESGLEALVRSQLAAKRLRFSTDCIAPLPMPTLSSWRSAHRRVAAMATPI